MTQKPDIDYGSLTPLPELPPEDTEDDLSFSSLVREAEEFLLWHTWCREIRHRYVGIVHEGIVAVFLFEIDPARPDVDELLWVVTGDLPTAYPSSPPGPGGR